MDKKYIEYCLSEYFKNNKKTSDKKKYLETALFIEDVTGIVLDENEISEENLKTYNNVLKLLYKKGNK